MAINGLTIREGFTDLGTVKLSVTNVEQPQQAVPSLRTTPPGPAPSRNALFRLLFNDGTNVPIDSPATFEITTLGTSTPPALPDTEITAYPDADGYISITLPAAPVIAKGDGWQGKQIGLSVSSITGPPTTALEECYLQVNTLSTRYYTLITDLVVNSGNLAVTNGEGTTPTYYNVYPAVNVSSYDAIYINVRGEVYGYMSDAWGSSPIGTLQFARFTDPASALSLVVDGIYSASSSPTYSGVLGRGDFDIYRGNISNADIFPVKLTASATIPGYSSSYGPTTFNNIMPGSMDFTLLSVTKTDPDTVDWPDLGDVQAAVGRTFSTELLTFLNGKGLTDVYKIRKAGPLVYVDGMPDALKDTNDVRDLQAHTDFYSINPNPDLTHNQVLLNKDYYSVGSVARTQKDKFVTDIQGSKFNLFEAAAVHETTGQNSRLTKNMLAGLLNDLKLIAPGLPPVTASTFVTDALSDSVSPCGCSDCQSALSPFAYLTDLITYGSDHITVSDAYQGLDDFMDTLTTYFIQPFASFPVSCETLHQEFCRVRLVTEVLETVAQSTHSTEPAALAASRKQFLMLVYASILQNAGTSFSELRDVVTAPADKKNAAAQKLSDQLGIPLYTNNIDNYYVVDYLWLSFNVAPLLNAAKLEETFGFRNTAPPINLAPVAKSLYEGWQDDYLRDVWKSQDYLLSAYSREDVDPASSSTFKLSWKPIVDPDMIGWGDMTYVVPDATVSLWKRRKEDTDAFLTSLVGGDTSLVSLVSADLKNRIVRVTDLNIVTDVIENQQIQLNNGTSWITFNVQGRKIADANTDVYLTKPTPTMFMPDGTLASPPTMRYNRVIAINVSAWTNPLTVSWSGAPLADHTGVAKVTSTGDTTVYQTSDSSLSVSWTNDSQAILTFATAPSTAFTNGTVSFIFGVEVPLYIDSIVDPSDLIDKIATHNGFSYTLLPPAPSGLTSPFPYTVWDLSSFPGGITTGSNYEKLKQVRQLLNNGTNTDDITAFITGQLHTTVQKFNRVMDLLQNVENYEGSMYTAPKPTSDNLYEMASIFRSSAKVELNTTWVAEEITHQVSGAAINIQLLGQHFWKAVEEPIPGAWDPSLNTYPVIDPELLERSRIVINPPAAPYFTLYDSRATALSDKLDDYTGMAVTFDQGLFTKYLNDVNTDNPAHDYSVSPYLTLTALINDLNDQDPIKQKKAADAAWTAFRTSPDELNSIVNTKNAYESSDAAQMPGSQEMQKTIALLVSAYKRRQLYSTWASDEINGSYSGGSSGVALQYYNVLKFQMAPGRGDYEDRALWQQTLAAWNRQPFIQPDIVPAEDILKIGNQSVNWAFTTWVSRYDALESDYSIVVTVLTGGLAVDIFSNFQYYLSILIARFSAIYLTTTAYLHYFTDLAVMEANDEDIQPYLDQYGITMPEYRVLQKTYTVLETVGASPTAPNPLLDSEIADLASIIIHIRSVNLSYHQVYEEYSPTVSPDFPVTLGPDWFIIYQPPLTNFPLTNLPVYNPWRSPYNDRKNWTDTLQSRIDRESAVKADWQEVLLDAEDNNMPLLRDALINSLRGPETDPPTPPTESFHDAAERLAKTYLIETEDNCCVKHTRISFAIETMQTLFFNLQNGIFIHYVSAFDLVAPTFTDDWQWLGTYGSWRSAVFVYLYPENLLYPTLKPIQSPVFQQITQTLQDASRFSPQDACAEGKKFQQYLDDLESLDIICTTNGSGTYHAGSGDCCDDSTTTDELTTYYFGKSNSGNYYWCSKSSYDNSENGPTFWQQLTFAQEGVNVLGCNYMIVPSQSTYLCLFYTYLEGGKLSIKHLRKDLKIINSDWKEQSMPELPSWVVPGYTMSTVAPQAVTSCQVSDGNRDPSFIMTYKVEKLVNTDPNPYSYYHVFWPFSYLESKFREDAGLNNYFSNQKAKPLTAIDNYGIDSDSTNTTTDVLWTSCTVVFPQQVIVMAVAVEHQDTDILFYPDYSQPGNYDVDKVIGVFECKTAYSTVIMVYMTSSNQMKIVKMSLTWKRPASASQYDNRAKILSQMNNLTVDSYTSCFLKISPNYSATPNSGLLAVYGVGMSNGVMHSAEIDIQSDNTVKSQFIIALTPAPHPKESVQSAECVGNMQTRTINVKNKLIYNMNPPEGISQSWILKATAIREVVYEAFYFVPMLLGLDQQARGQYPSALNWYRTIYDYTLDYNIRKIFYGLVLEETGTNVFEQMDNWISDPLNPHSIARSRVNAYTKYTLMNIIQCVYSYADQQYTMDTIETVPIARELYSEALGLLTVPELNMNKADCLGTAQTYMQNNAPMPMPALSAGEVPSQTWTNLYNLLIEKISEIGDIDAIQTIITEPGGVADALADDSSSIAQRFAIAFDIVTTGTPEPAPAHDISWIANGTQTNLDHAFRYAMALTDTSGFNATVRSGYQSALANTSGVSLADIATGTNLQWIVQPTPANGTPFSFSFATDGVQKLKGDLSFNPTSPTDVSFKANVNYSNAGVTIANSQQQSNQPPTFAPLLNYHFCTPDNPVYGSLTLKGNLELYKIFNCRNIAGVVRELDVYGAATDSVTGLPVIGPGGTLVLPGTVNYAPSQYRFATLIDRAKQICAQAQQMESLFLAALEKTDAENNGQLQAQQGLETANATVTLQNLRITQANAEVNVASLQVSKATDSQKYFSGLINAGKLDAEKKSIDLLNSAVAYINDSVIAQGVAAGLFATASIISATKKAAVDSLNAAGQAAGATSAAFSGYASKLSTMASIQSQQASYDRMLQDWTYQNTLATDDINIGNAQVSVATDNVQITTQERDVAQMNADHAQASLDFLKNKFTNAELYSWMGNILERSYSYMLNLATSLAKSAEGQLYFERQQAAGPFILNDYWEAPSSSAPGSTTDRRGLTGSARLLVDITRLDDYAFETDKRKLQLTKQISVAANFPMEFQQFKETGVLTFGLTNQMLDYDFPGHYLRLIRSVKTTVVGLLPVYDGIKAMLTTSGISYTVTGGLTFQTTTIKKLEADLVALSSPNNASGVFDLQPMNQDMLNPFEGTGIESRWQFVMPQFSNRLDYNDIADIVFTVEYTALDSPDYRAQVLRDLDNSLTFNRGFSLRNNFPDQWYELGNEEAGQTSFGITIQLTADMFPQGLLDLQLNKATDIILHFVRSDDYTGEVDIMDFNRVTTPASSNYLSGTTVNGTLKAKTLMNIIGNSPLVKLQLVFDDNLTNRNLFSDGSIQDVLFIIPCKAGLKSYPI